jgi:hypothetical protein
LLKHLVPTALLVLALAAPAAAQQSPWSVDFGAGWDNGLSGNVHSAGIGTINGQPTIIEARSYGDIYGSGVFWRFGGGYLLDDRQEVLATVTYNSVSADITEVGSVSGLPLFATFDDYTVWGIEGGYRYYFQPPAAARVRPYAGASIGVNIIKEIDADFAVPQAGLTLAATDFYDGTAAFTFGVNGGALVEITERLDFSAQVGLRHVGGLSAIDGLAGTGLEDINDDSGRWILPVTFGLRVKF